MYKQSLIITHITCYWKLCLRSYVHDSLLIMLDRPSDSVNLVYPRCNDIQFDDQFLKSSKDSAHKISVSYN